MALIPDPKVARRYGVVARTIARWDDRPELGFPRPTRINGRKYRDEQQLDAWDKANALKVSSAPVAVPCSSTPEI